MALHLLPEIVAFEWNEGNTEKSKIRNSVEWWAVLIPKYLLLKEWAYAGLFFAMSGAIYSHVASGDPVTETLPAVLLLVLTFVSWYFRPADRKLNPV